MDLGVDDKKLTWNALDTAPSVILGVSVDEDFGHGTKCNVPLGECYYY